MPKQTNNRRDFLKTASLIGAGTAAPYFFSAAPTLAAVTQSKNDRPNIGIIGCGGIAAGNMGAAREYVDIVAVADVDTSRAGAFSNHFSNWKADAYSDYRRVLERKDVEVVHVATPDHWHTKPVIEAMRAGKDVYCEKPLTLTIDEGKLIRKVQQETGRVVQVGTQQRSTFNLFVKALALVAEGRLGKVHHIEATIDGAPVSRPIPVAKSPKHLNWDMWLGPAPQADYRFLKAPPQGDSKWHPRDETNCHYTFRWWYEYSGGKLTDWGAHHVDIAVWALELNGQPDGPLAVGGQAEHPVEFVDGVPQQNDRFNTATSFKLTAEYTGGTTIDIVNRSKNGNGVLIEGDKGRLFVSRNKLVGKPVEELKENPLPEDAIQKVYKGFTPESNERRAHWINFLRCVESRKQPISDVHSHMRALNVCHLAGISARLGRKVNWDAKAEQITGDEQANSMLARPYREGYEIEG